MDGLSLITLCLMIGFLLARLPQLPPNFSLSLNTFVIQVSLPALILKHLHALPLQSQLLLPFAMPWLAFLIAATAAWVIGRIFGLKKESIGCLMLVCGTSNTSIVGVPMVQTYLGSEAIGYALVADQANFIVMCTLGIFAAALHAPPTEGQKQTMWAQIFSYRPMQAMLIALALKPFAFPVWLDHSLATLGQTLTPLAIISIGVSLKLPQQRAQLRNFLLGTATKLLLVPALVYACYRLFAPADTLVFKTSVLQAAMPPMIIAGLIASDKKLDAPLAQLLIGLGIPLSFVSIFCWSLLLK